MRLFSKYATTNEAQRIREALGADAPEAFVKPQYRHATPRRAPAGNRAGIFGKGLRKWITRQQFNAVVERSSKKLAG